jgi:hypothetical protein
MSVSKRQEEEEEEEEEEEQSPAAGPKVAAQGGAPRTCGARAARMCGARGAEGTAGTGHAMRKARGSGSRPPLLVPPPLLLRIISHIENLKQRLLKS